MIIIEASDSDDYIDNDGDGDDVDDDDGDGGDRLTSDIQQVWQCLRRLQQRQRVKQTFSSEPCPPKLSQMSSLAPLLFSNFPLTKYFISI